MPDFEFLDSPKKLADFCAAVGDAPRIAFDTEFIPEHTYLPDLCLVQVATDHRLAIIDPRTAGDLAPFWKLLIVPQREVVVHAGKEELNFCLTEVGNLPTRLFDVQLAAGFAGFGYPLSLANLVLKLIGAQVTSDETRTDWSKRPLTPRQIQYALDDVRHLLAIRDRLGQELDRRQRVDWLASEVEQLIANVRGSETVERFRKVTGSNRLSATQLSVLRELYRCREERAKATNKPVRWILRDDLLIDLAKRQPTSLDDLKRTRGMGQIANSRWVDSLLEAVQRGREAPREDRPPPAKRRETPDEQMVQKILAAAVLQVSQSQGVAAQLIGSGDDIRQLIDWHSTPDDARSAKFPRLLSGWRVEVCGKHLSALLEGNTVFRIQRDSEGFKLNFEAEATFP